MELQTTIVESSGVGGEMLRRMASRESHGEGAGGEWEFEGGEDLGGRKGRFKTKDERDGRQETEPTNHPPQGHS